MEITIVGETVRPAEGGAKADRGQACSGGFDMAMAAVMALLMPNSGAAPPAPNPVAGGCVFTEDITCPSAENKNSQKTADIAPRHGLLPGTPAFAALDADGTAAKDVTVEEVQMPPPHTAQVDKKSTFVSVLDAEPALKKAEPAPENFFPRQAAMPDGAAGPGGRQDQTAAILPEAIQNNNITAGGEPARAAPSGLTSNAEKTALKKTVSGIFTPDANARAAAAKVNIVTETAQGRGTGEAEKAEGKLNDTLSGKIIAGGISSAGEAKNESGGFNSTTGDTFQPDPAQINAAGTQAGSAKNLKGVALPDLKDVMVQEIKHIYDTRKGEPTQIQIKLEPENLGKLTIKLSYSNGELNAHFYAGSDHVKEILEGSIQQLRESLDRQELTLNQAFVFVGDENSGAAGGQMEFGSRRAEFYPDRYAGPNYPQPNMEPDDYYRLDTDYSGVNYLI